SHNYESIQSVFIPVSINQLLDRCQNLAYCLIIYSKDSFSNCVIFMPINYLCHNKIFIFIRYHVVSWYDAHTENIIGWNSYFLWRSEVEARLEDQLIFVALVLPLIRFQ